MRKNPMTRMTLAVLFACTVTSLALPSSLGTTQADTNPRRPSREIDDPRAAQRLLEYHAKADERAAFRPAANAAGSALQDAIAWLVLAQNASGSWGLLYEFPDTATVVNALGRAQPAGLPFDLGAGWLSEHLAADSDELSRQIRALQHAAGLDTEELVNTLLAYRNPTETDPAVPSFPEGGWGLDAGYETDSLTTALALSALERTGLVGGIGAVDEELATSGTHVHEWAIPGEATTVKIVITVGGADVLLRMAEGGPPTPADPFVMLAPGGPHTIVFPDSLPFDPGTNFISIESSDPPGFETTYTFTASYQTPEIDTGAFAEALDYLRQAQNTDGGWGIQAGEATSLFTSLHVLLALLAWQDYDFDSELDDGIAYLLSRQLADGSFGVSGTTLPYMTALAVRTLIGYEVCPLGLPTVDAIGALLGQQSEDGSWDQEPFDTGLALMALWEYDNDGDGVQADGDCSGVAGDNPCAAGMTNGCDDNCVAHANEGQGSVVFGEDIVASDGETFSWTVPADVEFVRGDLAAVNAYAVSSMGSVAFAASFSTAGDIPSAGGGFYYLRPIGRRLYGQQLAEQLRSRAGS